jgi:hypothetical protein
MSKSEFMDGLPFHIVFSIFSKLEDVNAASIKG